MKRAMKRGNKAMIRHQYVIVGAGPAGVQLGYYFQKMGADYVILERADRPGSFFEEFPRHRTLISINKRFTGSSDREFNMRHDWNSLLTEDLDFLFRDYDQEYFPCADNLVQYLGDFAQRYELNIQYSREVVEIDCDGAGYRLRTGDGPDYRAEALIVATGFCSAFVPDIPGVELAENYMTMSIDRAAFENQRVLIIGKGNSGFETADHLVPSAAMIHLVSPRSLTMAWQSHYVGHLRALNNNILDTYQLKSQNAVIDADVLSIVKQDDEFLVTVAYKHAQGEVETLRYDAVLCCAGFRLDDGIFADSAKPALTIKEKYPQLTAEFESVNRQNMYFAGTLTHSLDYHKTTSGFIHGFRYNVRALSRILAKKYGGQDWPEYPLALDPSVVAHHVLDRVNRSGGLWQQPGFVADYFYLSGDRINYGDEMPLAYVRDFDPSAGGRCFAVTLEYGRPITGDPFRVERVHRENVDEAMRSRFLHPIVRALENGHTVAEHHVLEDLESKWVERVHFEPLIEFLERNLGLEAVATPPRRRRAGAAADTVA